MRFSTLLLVSGASATVLAAACVFVDAEDSGGSHRSRERSRSQEHSGEMARATIEAKSGSTLSGTGTFTAAKGGVVVTLEVWNASPGMHAVHIHEVGDCSAADGTSAGGHFNPAGHEHGSPDAPIHHAGDLGNMWVGADGTGYKTIFMPELTVSEGANAVRGRAIIVHAGVDDLTSQPTGAAGGRIGCGVIR